MKKQLLSLIFLVLTTFVLTGCLPSASKKKDEEARKNTVECQWDGERLLVRFDNDEVRVLMANGTRIYLYRMPSSRGILYTNGDYELLGKGTDITFGPPGETKKLECKPYDVEDTGQRKEDRRGLKEMDVY